MCLKLKNSTCSILLMSMLCLATLAFALSGCAVFGMATPTPTPAATINPASLVATPLMDPTIDCPTAVQLVMQKVVNEVQTYTAPDGFLDFIYIYVSNPTQVNGTSITSGEQEVQTGQLDNHPCLNQILAAVKSVDNTLPANAQIAIINTKESS